MLATISTNAKDTLSDGLHHLQSTVTSLYVAGYMVVPLLTNGIALKAWHSLSMMDLLKLEHGKLPFQGSYTML